MKTYDVTIEGVTPLLMNRPGQEIAEQSKERKHGNLTNKEMAESKLYEIDGKIYQPSTHIQGALIEAGKHKKMMKRGSSKATYSKIVGYAVEINPFEIVHKHQNWEIFSILAVNPTTKGRNMLHRPILKKWALSFEVVFDDTEIAPSDMKELFDIAGRIVGIGDWRPQKKGRFGKFQVTNWKEAK